jgi:NADH-ubiquinone oxidoreductase chain 5
MEGPTPVSALIHAATMVTAGVFLVIRCSIIFEQSSSILFFMVFIGSFTCFLMSFIGVFQQDIKKIVAYSTCSQLGYLFIGCGLSSYNVSFFHLFNHAFFKALLFLSMGVIIHALADEQDLRKMGSLINLLPLVGIMVFFGNYALLGLPFLAGFYSKDLLIEIAYSRIFVDGAFSYILGLSAAGLTAFYSTRLFIRIFFGFSNNNRSVIYKIHEADLPMYFSLISLLFCSFFVGYVFFDLFCGLGSYFFTNSIYIEFTRFSGFFVEFESTLNLQLYCIQFINIIVIIKVMPLIITVLGFLSYYHIDNINYKFYKLTFYRKLHLLMYNGLFFDKLYVDYIVGNFLRLSYYSYYKNIEALVFQKYNIYIFEKLSHKAIVSLKFIISGKIYSYILLVLVFVGLWFILFISFYFLNVVYFLDLLILISICFFFNTSILIYIINNLDKSLFNRKRLLHSSVFKKSNIKRFYFTDNKIAIDDQFDFDAQFEDQFKSEFEDQLKSEFEDQLKSEFEDQLKSEFEDKLKSEFEDKLKSEFEDQLKSEFEDKLKSEFEDQLKSEFEYKLKSELEKIDALIKSELEKIKSELESESEKIDAQLDALIKSESAKLEAQLEASDDDGPYFG